MVSSCLQDRGALWLREWIFESSLALDGAYQVNLKKIVHESAWTQSKHIVMGQSQYFMFHRRGKDTEGEEELQPNRLKDLTSLHKAPFEKKGIQI